MEQAKQTMPGVAFEWEVQPGKWMAQPLSKKKNAAEKS